MTKRIRQTVRARQPVQGGSRSSLELRADEIGDAILPAILLLPDGTDPAPAALLIHGYSSRKETMSDSIGRALLEVGVASLAIDLPMHGERAPRGRPRLDLQALDLMRDWRLALAEASLGLRYLAARPEIDHEALALVGYSLGAFLGIAVASRTPALGAVVLAAGGDLPSEIPFAAGVRAMFDPLREIRRLSGTPLLMIHGRWDRTVSPAQAQRLFDAAEEPKEIRWWDAGHRLPPEAIALGAHWLAERLDPGGRRAARATPPGARAT